jgi:transcriptional regulator with PAS, ATPase and Fis domain
LTDQAHTGIPFYVAAAWKDDRFVETPAGVPFEGEEGFAQALHAYIQTHYIRREADIELEGRITRGTVFIPAEEGTDLAYVPVDESRVPVTLEQDTQLTAFSALVQTDPSGSSPVAWLRSLPSKGMKAISDLLDRVAETESAVLIQGEPGVGKTTVARAIFAGSRRSQQALVSINCGAIPEALLEAEFFGHVKGAFTGATKDKPGLVELADRGTLLLEAVNELPIHFQAKVSAILEEGLVRRLGAVERRKIDLRVIAEADLDLSEAVAVGRFRDDLFYRLSVLRIEIPPLRYRREDIPVLAEHFRQAFNLEHGRDVELDRRALAAFSEHTWPGNVLELRNVVERMVILGDASAKTFVDSLRHDLPEKGNLRDISRRAALAAERAVLLKALERVDWDRREAARLLGISVRTLVEKVSALRLARYGSTNR